MFYENARGSGYASKVESFVRGLELISVVMGLLLADDAVWNLLRSVMRITSKVVCPRAYGRDLTSLDGSRCVGETLLG